MLNMSKTMTVSPAIIEMILTKLDRLEKAILKLVEIIEADKEPPYGTSAWWEWSDKKALEDYRKGKYTSIKTHGELDKFFANLSE